MHPQVSLRPEPFGALAYHFGTRRLSFLRSHDMVDVVVALDASPTVRDALSSAGVDETRWGSFATALSTLERSEMIRARPATDR
jgi:putative mycofactocin binding protein MftB